MPLQRRLPKRGFKNHFRKVYAAVNIKDLSVFEKGSEIDAVSLIQAGLINKIGDGIKLLGDGEITYPVNVKVDKVSRAAREKIESAGGKIELV